MRLTARGSWPGRITLRHNWAKAEARPWNRDIPEAQLRLVRGGDRFLADCALHLLGEGTGAVNSPPLPSPSMDIWRRAGYEPYLSLDLFSRELARSLPAPQHHVVPAGTRDLDEPEEIDRRAFDALWRLDRDGLDDALGATPRSTLLVTTDAGRTTGYAIVGAGSIAGYLQRVAVHPDFQGSGLGRSLVRASMGWARRHGAHSILLNTQPDNEVAASLYRSEGFERLLDRLTVLRRA